MKFTNPKVNTIFAMLHRGDIVTYFFRYLLKQKIADKDELEQKIQDISTKEMNRAITEFNYRNSTCPITPYITVKPHNNTKNNNQKEFNHSIMIEIEHEQCRKLAQRQSRTLDYYFPLIIDYMVDILPRVFRKPLNNYIRPYYPNNEEYKEALKKACQETSAMIALNGLHAEITISNANAYSLYQYLKQNTFYDSISKVDKSSMGNKNTFYNWNKRLNPYKACITLKATATLSPKYEHGHEFEIRFIPNKDDTTRVMFKAFGEGAKTGNLITDVISTDTPDIISRLTHYVNELNFPMPIKQLFERVIKQRVLPAINAVEGTGQRLKRNLLKKQLKRKGAIKTDEMRMFIIADVIAQNPHLEAEILKGLNKTNKQKIKRIAEQIKELGKSKILKTLSYEKPKLKTINGIK